MNGARRFLLFSRTLTRDSPAPSFRTRTSLRGHRWQTRRLHEQRSTRGQAATAPAPLEQDTPAPPPPSDSSNPALSFPCLDAVESRSASLSQRSLSGPEPSYTTGKHLTFHSRKPLLLDWGGILPEFDVAYETWGQLNKTRSNAILLHTGLSASSHAHSTEANPKPGWWEKFIGPGRPLDTDKYFVICTNVIGGCYGSTGPSSLDPANSERYATRFPILTMEDMVRAQFRLLDEMGIEKLYASVGSSMGGMQSLAAGVLEPERVGKVVSISGCARSHPFSIAMRHTQRQGEHLSSTPSLHPNSNHPSHSPHDRPQLVPRFLLRLDPTPRRHETRPPNRHHHLPQRARMGTTLRAATRRPLQAARALPRLPDRNLPRPRGREMVSGVRRQQPAVRLQGHGPLRPGRRAPADHRPHPQRECGEVGAPDGRE